MSVPHKMAFWGMLGIMFVLNMCQQSEALRCFECNSYHDADCAVLDSDKLQPSECPSNATSCKIITQDAPFKADSKSTTPAPGSRTYRGCSSVSVKDFGSSCIDRVGTDKVKIRYCLCGADGCNEGPSTVRLSSWTMISFLSCLVWFVNSQLI